MDSSYKSCLCVFNNQDINNIEYQSLVEALLQVSYLLQQKTQLDNKKEINKEQLVLKVNSELRRYNQYATSSGQTLVEKATLEFSDTNKSVPLYNEVSQKNPLANNNNLRNQQENVGQIANDPDNKTNYAILQSQVVKTESETASLESEHHAAPSQGSITTTPTFVVSQRNGCSSYRNDEGIECQLQIDVQHPNDNNDINNKDQVNPVPRKIFIQDKTFQSSATNNTTVDSLNTPVKLIAPNQIIQRPIQLINNGAARFIMMKPMPQSSLKCVKCQREFFKQDEFNLHLNRAHKNRYQCLHCDESFDIASKLRRHNIVHSNYRPFKCNVCGLAFKRKAHMIEHTARHNTKEKNLKCNYCEMSFYQSRDRNLHEVVHSEEKPFPCDECPLAFKLKSYLNKHKARSHGQ